MGQKIPRSIPRAHKSGLHVAAPSDGEVTDLSSTYDRTAMPRRQKQQLLFVFSLFLLIGLLMVTGHVVSKPRSIASEGAPIPVNLDAPTENK